MGDTRSSSGFPLGAPESGFGSVAEAGRGIASGSLPRPALCLSWGHGLGGPTSGNSEGSKALSLHPVFHRRSPQSSGIPPSTCFLKVGEVLEEFHKRRGSECLAVAGGQGLGPDQGGSPDPQRKAGWQLAARRQGKARPRCLAGRSLTAPWMTCACRRIRFTLALEKMNLKQENVFIKTELGCRVVQHVKLPAMWTPCES